MSGKPKPGLGALARLGRGSRRYSRRGLAKSAQDASRLVGESYVDQQSRLGALSQAAEGNPNRADAPTPTYPNTGPLNIPDIRNMPIEDALALARKEIHLQPSKYDSEGAYRGSPSTVTSKRKLNQIRKTYDDRVEQGAGGADWYARQRDDNAELMGYDPQKEDLFGAISGQWSAGVSPYNERHFVLKEMGSALGGTDEIGKFSPAHRAFREALEGGDEIGTSAMIGHNSGELVFDKNKLHLGKKTGKYAEQITPGYVPSASGVTDFRQGAEIGHTDRKSSFSDAEHQYADYEMAHAVDRARQKKIGGRDDWNGEMAQAATWVVQKAEDLFATGKFATFQDAFDEAKKNAGDYNSLFDSYATYEEVPGRSTRHLSKLPDESDDLRQAYTDFGGGWNIAPGGRDAIYSDLSFFNTKGQRTPLSPAVRPSQSIQGVYDDGTGAVQHNPGNVARMLVTYNKTDGGGKVLTQGYRNLLNAGEFVRAFVDAQDAGGAHAVFRTGKVGKDTSVRLTLPNEPTTKDILRIQAIAKKHGLKDVVHTGEGGLTITDFEKAPSWGNKKQREAFLAELQAEVPESQAEWVSIIPGKDTIWAGLADAWKAKEGSGAVTRRVLQQVGVTPETYRAFNGNRLIGLKAADNLERDEIFSKTHGNVRQDIQNARRIIADAGAGWVDALHAALKRGEFLPVVGAALITEAFLGDAPAEAAEMQPKNTERMPEMYDRRTTEDGYYRMPEGL